MDIKIFVNGFKEEDYNKFCRQNIVYRSASLLNGDVHVFYKDPKKVGNTAMERIEEVDRLCKQADNEALAAKLNKEHLEGQLADLTEKLAKTKDKDERKPLEDRKRNIETQMKMDDGTIKERTEQISAFNVALPALLAEIED